MSTAPKSALLLGGLLVSAFGIWLLRAHDPNVSGGLFPPCVFRLFTGLYCPLCGATRALHALVHFDPLGALRMNALLVLVLPAMALLSLGVFGSSVRRRGPLARWLASPWLWVALVGGFWVVRNLPWPPFVLLAPPA